MPDALNLPDDLIALQRAADAEHARLEELTAEYGRPTSDWTEEQHGAWDAQLAVWRAAVAAKAVAAAPLGAEHGHEVVERELKKAARNPG
ncbi:hypothetical protein [Streptomyces syringium]|uniref:hypothetical protein n=1 Tax=Streptomyces syringium TaxID=76729 RepID=UPI0034569226